MSDSPTPDELLTEAQSTEAWNALPLETRKALVTHWRHAHIRHLEHEKSRLKRNYERAIREINEHIKNIQEGIRRG